MAAKGSGSTDGSTTPDHHARPSRQCRPRPTAAHISTVPVPHPLEPTSADLRRFDTHIDALERGGPRRERQLVGRENLLLALDHPGVPLHDDFPGVCVAVVVGLERHQRINGEFKKLRALRRAE